MKNKKIKDAELEAKYQKILQDVYDELVEDAIKRHNKRHKKVQWKVLHEKNPNTRYINLFLKSHGGCEIRIVLNLKRIQIEGRRGEGSTFTYLGRMLPPRAHYLMMQMSAIMLSFLRRKKKAENIYQWANGVKCYESFNGRTLKNMFTALCQDLNLIFGKRPQRLYDCANRFLDKDLEMKLPD